MMDWQTIQTAPKDGTEILLWAPDYSHRPGIGYWCDAVGAWSADIGTMEDGMAVFAGDCDGPTHWMPLPAPPKDRSSEEIIREDRDAWPDHQANDPIRASAMEDRQP